MTFYDPLHFRRKGRNKSFGNKLYPITRIKNAKEKNKPGH